MSNYATLENTWVIPRENIKRYGAPSLLTTSPLPQKVCASCSENSDCGPYDCDPGKPCCGELTACGNWCSDADECCGCTGPGGDCEVPN